MKSTICTFLIRFNSDGAYLRRSEWGRGRNDKERRRDALKTLEGIYGKENFTVVA